MTSPTTGNLHNQTGLTPPDLIFKFFGFLIGAILGAILTFIYLREDRLVFHIPGVEKVDNCKEVEQLYLKIEEKMNSLIQDHKKIVQKGLTEGRTPEGDKQLDIINKAFFKLCLITSEELPNVCDDAEKGNDVKESLNEIRESINQYMSTVKIEL